LGILMLTWQGHQAIDVPLQGIVWKSKKQNVITPDAQAKYRQWPLSLVKEIIFEALYVTTR